MTASSTARGRLEALAGALTALLAFWTVGLLFLDGFELGLGSLYYPTPRHARVLLLWLVLGGIAVVCLAHALQSRWPGTGAILGELSDRRFVLYATVAAALVPALLRQWLLVGTDVTDDESAYRLMARLLASGRLYMDSPPAKAFFDNLFLVNDGKLYSQYFLGWPALMAPGVWVGLEGWMNPLYSALTVAPLFDLVRRRAGGESARLAILCYLASPFLMIAAATSLSHTSSMAVLAWLFWVVDRTTGDGGRRALLWSAAALLFSLAFFIRPLTALGLGLPLLAVLSRRWLQTGRSRLRLATAFLLPALAAAALFLAVDAIQTGSPWKPAYVRTVEYARENGLRFSTWEGHPEALPERVPNLAFGDLSRWLNTPASGLWRLNFALFGWPCSFLLAFVAWRRRALLPLAMIVSFLLFHFALREAGIDLFGPLHYLELALPILVLTGIGATVLDARRRRRPAPADTLPTARNLVLACILAAAAGYVPVRLAAVHRIAVATATPWRTVESAGAHHAAVFVKRPFVSYRCLTHPSRGWLNSRPDNDPSLRDDVLWLNDLDLEADRTFLERYFPDRAGYVILWLRECRQVLLPLDLLEEPDADAPPR